MIDQMDIFEDDPPPAEAAPAPGERRPKRRRADRVSRFDPWSYVEQECPSGRSRGFAHASRMHLAGAEVTCVDRRPLLRGERLTDAFARAVAYCEDYLVADVLSGDGWLVKARYGATGPLIVPPLPAEAARQRAEQFARLVERGIIYRLDPMDPPMAATLASHRERGLLPADFDAAAVIAELRRRGVIRAQGPSVGRMRAPAPPRERRAVL